MLGGADELRQVLKEDAASPRDEKRECQGPLLMIISSEVP